MVEYVVEIPVLDPLVEGSVFDMPPGTDYFQCRAYSALFCLAHQGKTPGAGLSIFFRDYRPYDPDLPFVGIEGLDVIDIPEVDMLLSC